MSRVARSPSSKTTSLAISSTGARAGLGEAGDVDNLSAAISTPGSGRRRRRGSGCPCRAAAAIALRDTGPGHRASAFRKASSLRAKPELASRCSAAAGSQSGWVNRSRLAMSSPVQPLQRPPRPGSLPSPGMDMSTILPPSLPRQASKSRSFIIGATMTGADGTVRRRRPGGRNGRRRDATGRRDHLDMGAFDPPPAPEIESFLADAGETPGPELPGCPILRSAHLRGVGQAAANIIRQMRGRLHHLAVVHPLVDDTIEVVCLLRHGRLWAGRAAGTTPSPPQER